MLALLFVPDAWQELKNKLKAKIKSSFMNVSFFVFNL